MFRNLIFDWSGTLCDDLALTIEATNYVLAQYNRPALSREAFRAEFQLPYPDYYAAKTPEAKLEDLENFYRFAFDSSSLQVTEIPHARAFLEFCRTRGIRCFVLTSMDPRAFDEQSRHLNLHHYFEHIHSGVHNKEHYIPGLMKQHGLRAAETAFIGDMQHDINAAHCVGITGIGVLTGYNNATQLSQASPDITVPDLSYLQHLLEKIPAPQADSISIHSLEFTCRIGVPEAERALPQRLTADITLIPPTPFSSTGEDISRTICYDSLSRRLVALAQAEPFILLETLANRFASCCVHEFGALEATVELHKYILPNTASVSVRTTLSA